MRVRLPCGTVVDVAELDIRAQVNPAFQQRWSDAWDRLEKTVERAQTMHDAALEVIAQWPHSSSDVSTFLRLADEDAALEAALNTESLTGGVDGSLEENKQTCIYACEAAAAKAKAEAA